MGCAAASPVVDDHDAVTQEGSRAGQRGHDQGLAGDRSLGRKTGEECGCPRGGARRLVVQSACPALPDRKGRWCEQDGYLRSRPSVDALGRRELVKCKRVEMIART